MKKTPKTNVAFLHSHNFGKITRIIIKNKISFSEQFGLKRQVKNIT